MWKDAEPERRSLQKGGKWSLLELKLWTFYHLSTSINQIMPVNDGEALEGVTGENTSQSVRTWCDRVRYIANIY